MLLADTILILYCGIVIETRINDLYKIVLLNVLNVSTINTQISKRTEISLRYLSKNSIY